MSLHPSGVNRDCGSPLLHEARPASRFQALAEFRRFAAGRERTELSRVHRRILARLLLLDLGMASAEDVRISRLRGPQRCGGFLTGIGGRDLNHIARDRRRFWSLALSSDLLLSLRRGRRGRRWLGG